MHSKPIPFLDERELADKYYRNGRSIPLEQITYICPCGVETVASKIMIPTGWKVDRNLDCVICPDCAAAARRLLADEARTHDNSSAVNDEAIPFPLKSQCKRSWQVEIYTSTDKGMVHIEFPVTGDDITTAFVFATKVCESRLQHGDNVVSLTITPAALNVRTDAVKVAA
jgi:hypothetical protein